MTPVTRKSRSWRDDVDPRLRQRHLKARAFHWGCRVLTWSGVAILLLLLFEIGRAGLPLLSWDFLTRVDSDKAQLAGIRVGLVGSIWVVGLTALIAIPVGIGSAVYLEEYASRGRLSRFIEVNITNLAGVPSIVYGILGLTVFVRALALERSVLSGALTLSLLILPVIITAAREALRAVPESLRLAAFGLGATRSQVVLHHVLPAAAPGIATGVILALGRALGETAPLLMIGAFTLLLFTPDGLDSPFLVLPIMIYNWASHPRADFQALAAGGIVVLLLLLLVINSVAVLIRWKFERPLS